MQATNSRASRNAAVSFIFITVLIDVIGFGIIIPVMPKLLQELIPNGTMSDAARYGGWLIFAYALMQFFFSPIFGNLSDHFGRRPVLLISLFGFGLDYVFLSFAPSIGWLFIGRIFAGITGASFSTASAYIADVTPVEKRAQSFGMLGAAFGLGFIIGPAMGGIIAKWGLRAPFIAAACLTLINWLYGFFILPESLSKENRRPFKLKNANPFNAILNLRKHSHVLPLIVAFFLLALGSHAVQTTWSYYSIEKFNWKEADVGYSLAVVGIMVALVQGVLIRKAIPLLGQGKSVLTGIIFYSIGMLLFAFATKGWMMYAFTVIYCLGGITMPALQSMVSANVPANEQGELQGAMTGLMSA
ncbi:MAG: TCR/Tet family MFS transporter, partial [Chitinophagaceae bacterium]